MIVTDEMVEAACRGEWRHLVPDDDLSWDAVDEATKADWRDSVRAGLEAALNPDPLEAVPFVAVSAGERAPWEGESLDCPVCGEGPLELRPSDPPVLSFIKHCGQTWIRGPINAGALR